VFQGVPVAAVDIANVSLDTVHASILAHFDSPKQTATWTRATRSANRIVSHAIFSYRDHNAQPQIQNRSRPQFDPVKVRDFSIGQL
jgi:hypothetical protein